MAVNYLTPGLRYRIDRVLAISLFTSLLVHSGGLYAAYRWSPCVCHFGSVVCPKVCSEPAPPLDIELSKLSQPPPPPPKPKPRPRVEPEPVVIAEHKPEAPLAAPTRGSVVLPDEAFETSTEPPADITLDRPQLPEDVVVRESQARAPAIATAEIFGRSDQLTPGPAGVFGLGGTGKEATGIGPFGTAESGSGSGQAGPRAVPIVEPQPEAEPPKPKGPTRDPKVVNWTDPPYPEQARQQGIEGTVVLKLTVTSKGRPAKVAVYRSSGHVALDTAAVSHVRQAKFLPGLREGTPVDRVITFKVRFRLVNA
jgi:TonB family protein